jgi:hypothetical protein
MAQGCKTFKFHNTTPENMDESMKKWLAGRPVVTSCRSHNFEGQYDITHYVTVFYEEKS